MTRFFLWFESFIRLRGMILFGGIFIFLFFAQKVSYAQDQTGSFNFEGENRDYMVFFPDNYSNKDKFPLLIYLHGYDWTAEIDLAYTQLNLVTDTSGFILVTPNAVDKRWNNGGENPDWPAPDVDDVGFINALMDTLINRYSQIDLERIYVCGLSSGGFMTYRLACQLSHRIAAVASVGGLFISSVSANCNSLHTMPVLHIHGTKDNIVPHSGGEDALSVDQIMNYFSDLNGCVQIDTLLLPDLDALDKSTVEKISYTDCSDNSNIILYRVIDGGHNWPGAVVDYYWEGNRNMDINAGVEILNFFKNHKRVIPVGSFESFIPQEFKLIQNFPNPFYQTTTIEFELNKTSQVTLRIINILGEEVATLVSDRLNAGSYNYKWDAGNQARGIYLCRLQVGAFTQMKKMMLLE